MFKNIGFQHYILNTILPLNTTSVICFGIYISKLSFLDTNKLFSFVSSQNLSNVVYYINRTYYPIFDIFTIFSVIITGYIMITKSKDGIHGCNNFMRENTNHNITLFAVRNLVCFFKQPNGIC